MTPTAPRGLRRCDRVAEELDAALKMELQARGARARAGLPARAGGAGPADGVTLYSGDTVVSVPTGGLYVPDSPYVIELLPGGRAAVRRGGRTVCEADVAGEPAFSAFLTPGGAAYGMIASRHGIDGIGSTVVQGCSRSADRCAFCAISASGESGATTPRKTPEELALVAAVALEEGYGHFILTTGTTGTGDSGIPYLLECASAVSATGMRVHVQFEPPSDTGLIDAAAQVADTAAINIESFDERVRGEVTPGKSRTGLERYREAWRRAVSAFGPGRVTSFIIAGLGESAESIIEGARLLGAMGVYPFVLPLRPLPGTPLERLRPPAAAYMRRVYEGAASAIDGTGLKAAECLAGCVRCGACSAITDMTG